MIAYIMIGIPGSGKSFYAEQLLKERNYENIIIINRDKLREMMAVDYSKYDFKQYEAICISVSRFMISDAIKRCVDIIIDETNLKRKARRNIVNLIRSIDTNYKIIYVWCTEKKNNLKYRMESPKNVTEEKWKEIISMMTSAFEEPDEFEGYNEILTIQR